MTFEEAEKRLREACAARGFSYRLHYAEAENAFYGSVDGQGGEWAEVKRYPTLGAVMEALADAVEANFPLP